jgi:predicted DNA-binding transcriptional regulator AlpA
MQVIPAMAGNNEPTKALLRRREVMDWLGLADHEMTNLVKDGILKPKYFREGARAFFVKREIEKNILETEEVPA